MSIFKREPDAPFPYSFKKGVGYWLEDLGEFICSFNCLWPGRSALVQSLGESIMAKAAFMYGAWDGEGHYLGTIDTGDEEISISKEDLERTSHTFRIVRLTKLLLDNIEEDYGKYLFGKWHGPSRLYLDWIPQQIYDDLNTSMDIVWPSMKKEEE